MKKFVAVAAFIIAVLGVPAWSSAGGGGGCHEPQNSTARGADTDYMVIIHGSCILPTALSIAAGREVVFHSKDPFDHTITSGTGTWPEAVVTAGSPFSFTFAEPGIYPWYCRYHTNMGGLVVVGDALDNIPADTAPVDTTSVPKSDDAGTSIPLVVLPALAAAGVGFVAGRKRNGHEH